MPHKYRWVISVRCLQSRQVGQIYRVGYFCQMCPVPSGGSHLYQWVRSISSGSYLRHVNPIMSRGSGFPHMPQVQVVRWSVSDGSCRRQVVRSLSNGFGLRNVSHTSTSNGSYLCRMGLHQISRVSVKWVRSISSKSHVRQMAHISAKWVLSPSEWPQLFR